MTTVRKIVSIAFAAALAAQVANADVYGDTIGDEFTGNAFLDIVSVEILNDATDIMLTVNLNGDPIASDWGKYLVAIDSVGGGDTTSNGWARPISMSSGMDYFIGSWVDWGDGAEVYSWDGATWNLDEATYNPPSDIQFPVKTTSSVKLTTTLASLGMGIGDTFTFDVWTTAGGGTDSAIDALSDPSQTISEWNAPYNSTSTLTYTLIPEPATLSLVLVGLGVAALRRVRGR